MTNESEQVCACGHPKAAHSEFKGPVIGCCECPCESFRLSLPWPNEEGAWWTSNRELEIIWATPFLVRDGVTVEFCICDEGVAYHRDDFEKEFGPARFCRLLEKNPYTPSL